MISALFALALFAAEPAEPAETATVTIQLRELAELREDARARRRAERAEADARADYADLEADHLQLLAEVRAFTSTGASSGPSVLGDVLEGVGVGLSGLGSTCGLASPEHPPDLCTAGVIAGVVVWGVGFLGDHLGWW